MLELLKRVLTGQNQFASGGLLLMIIGGISVYLRAVPGEALGVDRGTAHHEPHHQG